VIKNCVRAVRAGGPRAAIRLPLGPIAAQQHVEVAGCPQLDLPAYAPVVDIIEVTAVVEVLDDAVTLRDEAAHAGEHRLPDQRPGQ
jgi:hypothetical protein